MYVCYLDTKDIFFGRNNFHNSLSTIEVCDSVNEVIHTSFIEGAQELQRGIWYLYLKDNASRLTLVTAGINIRGRHVQIHDSVPNTRDSSQLSEKIYIRNLPLDVENKYIEQYLVQYGVALKSDAKDSFARREDGTLTSFKTGERFIYAQHPVYPVLPQRTKIAGFPVTLFHQSQKNSCKACMNLGHKKGDACCPANIDEGRIEPFRSYRNKLSNMSPCDVTYEGQNFGSVCQAYQWSLATKLEMFDLARKIKDAPHAGASKELYKQIPESDRESWRESHGVDVMTQLVRSKFNQNDAHRRVLLSTDDKILAEATFDTFWGCGLTPDNAASTHPDYWPGKNWLGSLLMKLRSDLCKKLPTVQKQAVVTLKPQALFATQSLPTSPVTSTAADDDHQWLTDTEVDDPPLQRRTYGKRKKDSAKRKHLQPDVKAMLLKNIQSKRLLTSPDEKNPKKQSTPSAGPIT